MVGNISDYLSIGGIRVMQEYLVTYFTDSGGNIHESVKKSRFNQQSIIVKAESKEDAQEKARDQLQHDN